jgi:hypothetical protein
LATLNIWLRRKQEAAELDQRVADALLQAGAEIPKNTAATAAGDPRKLRGIPAIGYGVGGAIAGSQPERETIRRSESRSSAS